ncbi:MAG: sodium-dependent transporter [Ruminococcaceae bacterium]|nr:sodium-dependent transporter [Oscillospiraceae bacterium]
MERERLGSRLGFILISAGCAIGIGNVWKFPTVAAQNGGGIFVLIYLVFLAIMGIPIMTMEFSVGRASQASPVRMYQKLKPEDKKWRAHGYASLVGNIILMMFYTSVTGWMLQYFVYMLTGKFEGMNTVEVNAVYDNMLSSPWILILFVAIVCVLGFLVCSFNMQKGLEKVTKIMMVALLALIIVLAIHSFTLPKAGEGLKFYLLPSIENVKRVGFLNVVVAAMNQAFFTLSLGIGSMAIFGSFIGKDRSLLGESVNIACLDTFVAITSGLIIFPAFFTYMGDGVLPTEQILAQTAGPGLIFKTLPNVFINMHGGRIWGTLFFLFMSFAAFSTILAVFQNIMSCVQELTGWSKRKTCLICGVGMLILSIPCVLGFNVLSGFHPLGAGSVVLDLEDYIVSNILLPLGSLVFVLFCTNKFGWGFDNFMEEANLGKGLKIKKWMKYYMRYVLPVIVGVLFVYGAISPFIK